MITNYGYADATGMYYIKIDTEKCAECDDKPCADVCPMGIIEIIEDDWEDDVAAIKENVRNQLKDICANCLNAEQNCSVPCTDVCGSGAISHTWNA